MQTKSQLGAQSRHQAGPPLNLASEKTKGVLLLLSASMGIGCLGIPSSIAQVGFAPWIIIIFSVAAFYFLSYYVIMRLCDYFNAHTVSQLGASILGPKAFAIDFLFIVVNLAGYLACLITLNEDMPIIAGMLPESSVVDFLRESDYIWLYISTVITVLILVYIPVDKLHSVTFMSAVSSICLILFISMGLLYRTKPIDLGFALSRQNWGNKYSVFMFLGFAFLCQQNLMTLRQASNIQRFEDVMSTVRIFSFCILGIYGLIGFMGYLTFYDDPRLAHSNVLALYTNRDFFYSLMMVMVNLNIQVGNAVMLYPIRDIIMEYIYGPKPQVFNNKDANGQLDVTKALSPKSHKQVSVFFRNNKAEAKDANLSRAMIQAAEYSIEMANYPSKINHAEDSSEDSIDIQAPAPNPDSIKSAQKERTHPASIKENFSVKSISIHHNEVFNSLLQDELGFFQSYKNLERIVSVVMVVLCGAVAHMLVVMHVKFYDAVDFVSKVFFPILFFYLPIIGYVMTFKTWWILIPFVVFLGINIISFA